MASWRAEPKAVAGEWTCFRQVSPAWPPLYHNAGTPAPDQESGRWHRKGEGYAQYLALSPLGAWAECVRYYSVRSPEQAREMQRDLWLVFVRERRVADLSTFDRYDACGLDPGLAVDPDHGASRELADELRASGFRGVLSPSAALPGVVNLTVFGERYERVLAGRPRRLGEPGRRRLAARAARGRGGPDPGPAVHGSGVPDRAAPWLSRVDGV